MSPALLFARDHNSSHQFFLSERQWQSVGPACRPAPHVPRTLGPTGAINQEDIS